MVELKVHGAEHTIITSAKDIIVKDQKLSRTNGYETLSFQIPMDDTKRANLSNEDILEVNGREYVVRVIDDAKDKSKLTSVQCDATWYDLADGELITWIDNNKFLAKDAIAKVLEGTEWTVGIVDIAVQHSFTIDKAHTVLWVLRYIQQLFGGDMWFDTKAKQVNLVSSMGKKTNTVLTYEKNTPSIKRTLDSRNLITRLHMSGKDGITIADINGGNDYIDNYSWYDANNKGRKIKTHSISDERFTNLPYMKYWMEQWLAFYSKPTIAYAIKATSYTDFISLGDSVYVDDRSLQVANWLEVVERTICLDQPYKSSYTLESVYKNIVDNLNEESTTTTTNAIVSQTSITASPFNLLLNSRGDDGFAYWANDGFEVDGEGKSGDTSFKCLASSTTKKLEQSVYPGDRDSYVISAYIGTDTDFTYNPEAMIGIEVEIEYEDGTTQVEWVPFK